MTIASIKAALAGWLVAILSTWTIFLATMSFDLSVSPLDIVSGIAALTMYIVATSGAVVFTVWILLLFPLSRFCSPDSWILRAAPATITGSIAGTSLYIVFIALVPSDWNPLILIGTFTGTATGYAAHRASRIRTNTA